jgi:sugar/nucleoside kinase (ribokinase family)
MRRWDEMGRVTRGPWDEAEASVWLARADAVILSDEDVGGDETLIARYAAQTRLLVVTHGAAGCTVYQPSTRRTFPAPAVVEADPTGAGDVFAAAFFVALHRAGILEIEGRGRTGTEAKIEAAARFANCIASASVTRSGLDAAPTPEEAARCEQ